MGFFTDLFLLRLTFGGSLLLLAGPFPVFDHLLPLVKGCTFGYFGSDGYSF